MIPLPGSYGLTFDNVHIPGFFATLADARHAARMHCGATIVQWSKGNRSEIVERVPPPVPVPMAHIDLTAPPGRYYIDGTLRDFNAVCTVRALYVSCVYRYSGPSMVQTARDGLRQYEFREFSDYPLYLSELTIRQFSS